MHWPAHGVLTLRQIAGILASVKDIRNPFKQSEPLSGASVLLLDAKSGQQIGATVTNDQGHFSFDASVEPGLYILRISQHGLERRDQDNLIQGNIFVEVDTTSTNSELPKMNLIMTSCGLTAFTGPDQMATF
jgi:hypothetical protein